MITTAFQVTVTGNYGDTITLGRGTLYYKKTNSAFGADTIIYANQYKILITPSLALCPNALGANFSGESNGTFDQGTTQNRSYGPIFPIPNYRYTPLTPANPTGDGRYALVNNLSQPRRRTTPHSIKTRACWRCQTPLPVVTECLVAFGILLVTIPALLRLRPVIRQLQLALTVAICSS